MKNLRLISFLLFLALSQAVSAQSGGKGAFSSLNLSLPPRIASTGGVPLATFDNDLNLALYNPSLINKDIDKQIAIGFTDYFADIHGGYAAYSATFKKLGSLTAGIQYLNYGSFIHTDVAGTILGEFKAADYALQLGWGRSLSENFTMGANVKFAFSKLESYSSNAIAVDLAGSYHNKSRTSSASLIARNMGAQLKPFVEGNKEELPSELLFSFSHKLKKAPLRLNLTATHLEKWDMTYIDPTYPVLTVDPLTGEKLPEKKFQKFADKLTRHLVAGVTFMPTQNLQASLGYNYLRRQEMKVQSRPALVGFSWGIGVRVKKFHINYARAAYHLAGSTNHISISTSLAQW